MNWGKQIGIPYPLQTWLYYIRLRLSDTVEVQATHWIVLVIQRCQCPRMCPTGTSIYSTELYDQERCLKGTNNVDQLQCWHSCQIVLSVVFIVSAWNLRYFIRSQIMIWTRYSLLIFHSLYCVQRNTEWSSDFLLFGLVTAHADTNIWSDPYPKYLRTRLPESVYLIFPSPLPLALYLTKFIPGMRVSKLRLSWSEGLCCVSHSQ